MQRNYPRSEADSSFNFFTPTKDDRFIFLHTQLYAAKAQRFFLSIIKSVEDFVFFVMRFNAILFQSIPSLICFYRNVFLRAGILVILTDSIPIQIPLCKAALYFQCSLNRPLLLAAPQYYSKNFPGAVPQFGIVPVPSINGAESAQYCPSRYL